MNEQLVNDLKEYLSDDAETDGMISLSVKRAIRSFKKKRNYPSGYTEEKSTPIWNIAMIVYLIWLSISL